MAVRTWSYLILKCFLVPFVTLNIISGEEDYDAAEAVEGKSQKRLLTPDSSNLLMGILVKFN